MFVDFRIDVPIDLHDVLPSIIVEIDEAAAPSHILVVDTDSGRKRNIVKCAVTIVVVEIASIVSEVRFEDVKPAVTVVVGYGHAHS